MRRVLSLAGESSLGGEAPAVLKAVAEHVLGMGMDHELEQPARVRLAGLLDDSGGLEFVGEDVVRALYGEGPVAGRVSIAARGIQQAVAEGYEGGESAFSEFCREDRKGRVEATLTLRGYSEADCGEAWRSRFCGLIARILEVGVLRYDNAPLDPNRLAKARGVCASGEPHDLYIFADNSIDRVRPAGTVRSKPIVGGGPRSAVGFDKVFEWSMFPQPVDRPSPIASTVLPNSNLSLQSARLSS